MESLQERAAVINELIPIIKSYLDKISTIVDTDGYNKIFNKLKKQPEIDTLNIGSRKSVSDEKIIAELFDTYGEYITYFDTFKSFINLLSIEFILIEKAEISESLKREVSKSLESIKSLYISVDKLDTICASSIIENFTYEINILFPKKEKDRISFIQYINKLYHKNHTTISLYASSLQKILDENENTPLEREIRIMIERDKDLILSGNVSSIFKDRKVHLTNPPLQRFGLVPVTDSMPLNELFKIILIGSKIAHPSKKIDLSKMSHKTDYGFIVMNHIVITPIEYNIRPLVLKSVAEPLIQPDTYGPTEKMVERFKTIRSYGYKKWKFSYEIHNELAKYFFVLETLNGTDYRCLAPWIQTTKYFIDVKDASSLLEYITSKNKPNRMCEYQAVAIKKSIKNMFLPKALELESYEDRSNEAPSHVVRQDVIFELQHLAKKIIASDFNNTLSSPLEIANVLHDVRFRDAFYEKVLSMYPRVVLLKDIKKFDAGYFPFSELLSTFIVDLQSNTRKFMKEMHDGYVREPLKANVFTLPDSEKMQQINLKIMTIIEKATELVIRDTENLYSSLHFKYLLLNFH